MITARLLEAVGHPQRLRLLRELKKTTAGLPVRTLAEKLELSYMGAKEICLLLEKKGLLETWRDAQPNGRPRLVYRLAEKTQALFPAAGPALTLSVLQAAHRLFGPAAPEKLLRLTVQEQWDAWAAHVGEGSIWQRTERLMTLRAAAGWMGELLMPTPGEAVVVERHSPWEELVTAYPVLMRLEAEGFQRLLGTSVVREDERVAGHHTVRFKFATEPPI